MTFQPARGWPLTRKAHDELVEGIDRLRSDVAAMSLSGLEEGILCLPIASALARIRLLADLLEHGWLADDSPCAAIGRAATLRDVDGVPMTFRLVLPGVADDGCVAADSPLGLAVLGARPGQVLEISSSAGTWKATLVADRSSDARS
jgi:hypothetical protein